MLSRILRPSLQAPLRLQRSLATPAPASNSSPSTSTSNSSLALPPSIDSALRRSPALVGLVDDPLFRSSFGTVGRTMYEYGEFHSRSTRKKGGREERERERLKLTYLPTFPSSSFFLFFACFTRSGLDGEGSIGERFSQLYDSSRTLQVAIAEMRASNERLGVSDEVSAFLEKDGKRLAYPLWVYEVRAGPRSGRWAREERVRAGRVLVELDASSLALPFVHHFPSPQPSLNLPILTRLSPYLSLCAGLPTRPRRSLREGRSSTLRSSFCLIPSECIRRRGRVEGREEAHRMRS